MGNVELVVGDFISRGGFADVHLGTYGGSQVAIKVFRLPGKLSYPEHVERCMKEASILKSVCHNNVLRYINIRKNDDLHEVFLITEYIEGGSMERFCREERLPLLDKDKQRIACSCWRGLAFLHKEHIFHKDIKPQNILISKDLESVKIADFGLSETKNMCSSYSNNTLEGTAMYLPPELASPGDKKRYRRNPEKSDVYSMGVTLCEFFSGQPFWTYGYKPMDIFQVIVILGKQCKSVNDHKKPIDPSCWPSVSIEIQNILIHAINADYAKRKSANEMLDLFVDMNSSLRLTTSSSNKKEICKDQENDANNFKIRTLTPHEQYILRRVKDVHIVNSKTMDNAKLVIDSIIVRGAFADVHLGTYRGSQVAITVCRLPITSSYPEHVERCMKEALLLKSVCHSNVLRYISVRKNADLDEVYLITEYIEGGSMERFCGKERLPLPDNDKQCIAYSCWRGLAFLHKEHIFHKDIKPENILISKDLESVKIAGFGLSETKNICSTYSTNTLGGTAMYLPPDLALKGEEKLYRRNPEKSDVYSMGATLCEFFSGQPFWTSGNKPMHIFEILWILAMQCQYVKDQKKPIDPSCWPSISIEIQNILIHAINADYAKRKSANEMLVLFEDMNSSPRLTTFSSNKKEICKDQENGGQ
jgi:serine/threonine protein kinase